MPVDAGAGGHEGAQQMDVEAASLVSEMLLGNKDPFQKSSKLGLFD